MGQNQSSEEESNLTVEVFWREAEKQLPSDGAEVLCAVWSKGIREARETIKAEHKGEGVFETSEASVPIRVDPGDLPAYRRVTHWMPLPPRPEQIKSCPEPKNGAGKHRTQKRVERTTNNIGSASA